MRKNVLIVWTLLLLSVATSASADPGHWDNHRVEHRREFRSERGYHRHGWGWAPWVTAAAIGSTVYWANAYTPPTTTVIVSPPVVADPGRVAYFCQTAQQYYPNVPTCAVPWQIVAY